MLQIFLLQARCTLCVNSPKYLSYKNSSTKNLMQHAKSQHPIAWKQIEQKDAERIKKEIASQSKLEPIVTVSAKSKVNKYPMKSQKRQKLNDLLTKMIVDDLLPISIVERDGFREFVKELDPAYVPPTRKTISEKLIPKMFEKHTDEAKKELSKARYVSITTDAWTSNTTDG